VLEISVGFLAAILDRWVLTQGRPMAHFFHNLSCALSMSAAGGESGRLETWRLGPLMTLAV
jgi:hypothetical protein